MVVNNAGSGNGPRWLRKGWFLRAAFDDAYRDPATRQLAYDEALRLLRDDDKELFAMTEEWDSPQRGEFADEDRDHFRDHWLNEPWFNIDGDTAEYLRRAFRETIERAKDRDVGLEAIWITTGEEGGNIEVGYVDNPNSVLLVLKTPTIPQGVVAAKMTMKPGDDFRAVQFPHTLDPGPL